MKKAKKMNKSLILGMIVLALIIACGVVEVVLMAKKYDTLHQQAEEIMQKVYTENITIEEFDDFRENWSKLREISELLLPHMETVEVNVRMVETYALIEKQDFTAAYAQFSTVTELLKYIPSRMIPSPQHIM